MNVHKFALPLAFALALVVFFFASSIPIARADDPSAAPKACPGSWSILGNCATVPGTNFLGTTDNQALVIKTNNAERARIMPNGKVGIGTTNPTSRLEIAAQDGLAITGYQPYLTLRDANAGGARTIIQGANGDMGLFTNSFIGATPPLQIKNVTGYVGIGTGAPTANLTVVRAGAPQPNVQGIATALKVGAPAGTVPFALKQNAAESGTPTLAYFETNNGNLGYLAANAGAFVLGATAGKALAFNVNGASRAMVIASSGVIGVGTSNINAKLHVRGSGTTASTNAFMVDNANGYAGLRVDDEGQVHVALNYTNNSHLCYGPGGLVSKCFSASEYVPSVDGGQGLPETADLVSIAPSVSNPEGDEHSPFVIQKSTTACDPNLLGYITNPTKGADGEKKNDRYIPLAIFGYFPAKVTMLNGAIKRGDPLTSSDKPGYAMKATGACKIIGYALQDASVEGTIQVFAHLSENTAPQVATLQGQVDTLTQENLTLKKELSSIEARLAALEKGAPVTQNSSPQTWIVH